MANDLPPGWQPLPGPPWQIVPHHNQSNQVFSNPDCVSQCSADPCAENQLIPNRGHTNRSNSAASDQTIEIDREFGLPHNRYGPNHQCDGDCDHRVCEYCEAIATLNDGSRHAREHRSIIRKAQLSNEHRFALDGQGYSDDKKTRRGRKYDESYEEEINIRVHYCSQCGRWRSRRFHHENPLKPGKGPIIEVCSKCVEEEHAEIVETRVRRRPSLTDMFKPSGKIVGEREVEEILVRRRRRPEDDSWRRRPPRQKSPPPPTSKPKQRARSVSPPPRVRIIYERRDSQRSYEEEDVRRREAEDVRKKAEQEARKKEEQEARKKEEQEARKKEEQEARKKKDEETRKTKEEEACKKKEENRRQAIEKRIASHPSAWSHGRMVPVGEESSEELRTTDVRYSYRSPSPVKSRAKQRSPITLPYPLEELPFPTRRISHSSPRPRSPSPPEWYYSRYSRKKQDVEYPDRRDGGKSKLNHYPADMTEPRYSKESDGDGQPEASGALQNSDQKRSPKLRGILGRSRYRSPSPPRRQTDRASRRKSPPPRRYSQAPVYHHRAMYFSDTSEDDREQRRVHFESERAGASAVRRQYEAVRDWGEARRDQVDFDRVMKTVRNRVHRGGGAFELDGHFSEETPETPKRSSSQTSSMIATAGVGSHDHRRQGDERDSAEASKRAKDNEQNKVTVIEVEEIDDDVLNDPDFHAEARDSRGHRSSGTWSAQSHVTRAQDDRGEVVARFIEGDDGRMSARW